MSRRNRATSTGVANTETDDLDVNSALVEKEALEDAETKAPNVQFVGKKQQMIKEDVWSEPELQFDDETGEPLMDEDGEQLVQITQLKKAGEYEEVPVPDDEVPTEFHNGTRHITDLPDGATQKAGFYHPDGAFLRTNYRKLYKRPVTKGNIPLEDLPPVESGRDPVATKAAEEETNDGGGE